MADERTGLKESFQGILSRDKDLADKLEVLKGLANSPELRTRLESIRERVGTLESLGPNSALAWRRSSTGSGDRCWKWRTTTTWWRAPRRRSGRLDWAMRLSGLSVGHSVGRPDRGRSPPRTPVGGDRMADRRDVVVTNRHVASEFACPAASRLCSSVAGRTGRPGWRHESTSVASCGTTTAGRFKSARSCTSRTTTAPISPF